MSEWIDIADWPACRGMQRPGIVFELRNGEGQSLFTPCTEGLPELPWDWTEPPHEFRAVVEAAPEHSAPLPPPRG